MWDIVVVGGGTAGLTAGIYGVRAGCSVLVVEELVPGGQIVNTPVIDNYPGMYQTNGADFAMALLEQATTLGVELRYDTINHCDLQGDMKTLQGMAESYQAKTVVLANGLRHRKLGCPGEEEFIGKGVSYCATCDGAHFRGKEVALSGGGNTALEEALYLSDLCSVVHLIHRRDAFRAHERTVKQVKEKANIQIHYNAKITEILGDGKVYAVVLRDTITSDTRQVAVSGVFVAIGLEPTNPFYQTAVKVTPEGYIIAGEDCKTDVPGVYAAGDIRTKTWRQLVTAAADGAVAASEAAEYIRKQSMR